MSYANFKGEYWSAYIQTELAKTTVLTEFCDYKFEPESKGSDRVRILGVNKPTISDYTGSDITIEEVPDSAQWLLLDKAKYFAFTVDDVDKAQMNPDVMSTLQKQAIVALAETEDSAVAAEAVNLTKITKTTAVTTEALAIAAIDEAFEKLWDNGVGLNVECQIAVTPWFYNLFKGKLINITDGNRTNSIVTSGVVGYYNNAEVKMTNNLYNDGTYDCCVVRTKTAMAFARQVKEVEAFRPEKRFSDALKGLNVFGVKAVRPEEGICLKVKKS